MRVTFKALALNEALFTCPVRGGGNSGGREHHPILAYRADGLIISTLLAQRAFAVSGGPIVERICRAGDHAGSPHSLFNRPLVVDGEKAVYRIRENPHDPVLILDRRVEFHYIPPIMCISAVHHINSDDSMPERTFAQILNLKFNLGGACTITGSCINDKWNREQPLCH